MKKYLVILLIFILSVAVSGQSLQTPDAMKPAIQRAKEAKPRVALANDVSLSNADVLMTPNVPNYIKALSANTKSATQFANLIQKVIYGGTVPAETKMAMAMKIAEEYKSGYLYMHSARWLQASEAGAAVLNGRLSDAQKAALRYAELLNTNIHGVSDADFAKTKGFYNDAQMVELTMTVSFFNYFVRLTEGLNLPLEKWAMDTPARYSPATVKPAITGARVALISDDELAATARAVEATKAPETPQQGLGLGIANSQRAMLRVPDIAGAWREFGTQNRSTWSIERNVQLHISFAVSMVNGCRYCTIHQVLGLRRLGVDVGKLVAMKKDDADLTPRELKAVEFARILTKSPTSATNADFAKISGEFGPQGAVEVIMQTSNFAFMNRFTDGLKLPSEDEAIKVYQETYGENAPVK